ncbi:DUF6927 domain-containing protein [Deinococcus sp. SL84]|uniref:DUF6927 domain-containing protein n=1 Tax=Deinococcus sp. SL84 TaxID=2994663 RepID=UPI002273EFAF|nr:hypothetical protein [Deinococcus sp. SL84]MCY1704382.1 hypothetical protein [Deinococcus sp. SL84]
MGWTGVREQPKGAAAVRRIILGQQSKGEYVRPLYGEEGNFITVVAAKTKVGRTHVFVCRHVQRPREKPQETGDWFVRITLTRNVAGEFQYKDLEERQGPAPVALPEAFLAVAERYCPLPELSTEQLRALHALGEQGSLEAARSIDPDHAARSWRQGCRELWGRQNLLGSLPAGSHLRLPTPLTFTGNFKEDLFETVPAQGKRRSVYRSVGTGQLCRIPRLAETAFEVVRYGPGA